MAVGDLGWGYNVLPVIANVVYQRNWTWTIKLRTGVKFHDGTPMTADDVVATFERLTGPNSQALSSYGGVLSPGGTTKVDDSTVKFSLDAPNGIFPYLLGGMTYQAIVLPKTYQMPADLTKPGDWTSKMNGTGPFKLKENRGQAGLSFVANDAYWGGKPAIDAVENGGAGRGYAGGCGTGVYRGGAQA